MRTIPRPHLRTGDQYQGHDKSMMRERSLFVTPEPSPLRPPVRYGPFLLDEDSDDETLLPQPVPDCFNDKVEVTGRRSVLAGDGARRHTQKSADPSTLRPILPARSSQKSIDASAARDDSYQCHRSLPRYIVKQRITKREAASGSKATWIEVEKPTTDIKWANYRAMSTFSELLHCDSLLSPWQCAKNWSRLADTLQKSRSPNDKKLFAGDWQDSFRRYEVWVEEVTIDYTQKLSVVSERRDSVL